MLPSKHFAPKGLDILSIHLGQMIRCGGPSGRAGSLEKYNRRTSLCRFVERRRPAVRTLLVEYNPAKARRWPRRCPGRDSRPTPPTPLAVRGKSGIGFQARCRDRRHEVARRQGGLVVWRIRRSYGRDVPIAIVTGHTHSSAHPDRVRPARPGVCETGRYGRADRVAEKCDRPVTKTLTRSARRNTITKRAAPRHHQFRRLRAVLTVSSLGLNRGMVLCVDDGGCVVLERAHVRHSHDHGNGADHEPHPLPVDADHDDLHAATGLCSDAGVTMGDHRGASSAAPVLVETGAPSPPYRLALLATLSRRPQPVASVLWGVDAHPDF